MTATFTTPATVADAPISTTRRRDGYGRSVLHFEYLARTVVVLVTVPNKGGYIVNNWDKAGDAAVATFDRLADAKAHAATEAASARAARRENILAGKGNVA